MKIRIQRFSRAIPFASALGIASITLLSPGPTAAAESGARPAPVVQTWDLATGGEVDAAITGYSLQSRIISLRHPDGRTTHMTPRDLTATSKLKWLTSGAFADAIRGYRPPRNAWLTVVTTLARPVAATLLGAFLAFWFSVSMVSGQNRMLLAAKIYLKSVCLFILLVAITSTVLYAISASLGQSPIASLIQSATAVVAAITIVSVISNQIGSDYNLSGWAGLGTMILGTFLGFLMASVALYLLPRIFEQPGIDEWFTDQLLAPLGLA